MSLPILILDFGSQYTELLARRVREMEVYCEVHPFDLAEETIRDLAPQGVILSGGPDSVYENTDIRIPQIIFDLNVPILGVCYGMQSMAAQMGGTVEACSAKEFGLAHLDIHQSALLKNIPVKTKVWMSHGDQVKLLPPGFSVIASSKNTPIAEKPGGNSFTWSP